MKASIASELFSDKELWLIWKKSGCLGRFSSWLSRVKGNGDSCCERQIILDQEFLRYNGVRYDGVPYENEDEEEKKEEEIQKILCISGGPGRRTVWAGDCLDGLKTKLSELSSYSKLRSEKRKLETMEAQRKDV